MKRSIVLAILFICLVGVIKVHAETPKALFIREDGLWMKNGETEEKIVGGNTISYPSFSSDGSFISYRFGKSSELWVYNLLAHKNRRVFSEGATMARWSPVSPLLAWKSGTVLNVIDVSKPDNSFENVALGVGNYSWTPNGKGFIVSSEANLEPEGWSEVKLFEVPVTADGDPKKAKKIARLPKMSGDFFAISTTEMKWSSDGRKFAFIACPTASLSADSNTLMVINRNGSQLKSIGNMLNDPNWFQWAPHSKELAFIKGIGREQAKNKRLTIWDDMKRKETDLGFDGYADGDFTWKSERKLIISRQVEWGWDIPLEKRSRSFLVEADLDTKRTKRITQPPKPFSDVYPKTIADGELVWVRTELFSKKAEVMLKDQSGNEKLWIKNIKAPDDCYGWSCVLDVYQAR